MTDDDSYEKEFNAWKKRQLDNDEIEKGFQIPVEGFYNFYIVPWDSQKYVKFPCALLWVGPDPKANPAFGGSDFTIFAKDKKIHEAFLEGYLGTCRLTDKVRMEKITEEWMTELVLPE